MVKLLVKKLHAHLLERRAGSQQLGDNIGALALFCHHALQAAHLSLDPLEPIQQSFIVR